MTKNDAEFKCGLIWKGKGHLEIFAKVRGSRETERKREGDSTFV